MNAIDVQSDSEIIQMFAENGSDVNLKFWYNSLLTPEQLNKCNKVNPRKKAIQLLKDVFKEEADSKQIDSVIKHRCCKCVTMEHRKLKNTEASYIACVLFETYDGQPF